MNIIDILLIFLFCMGFSGVVFIMGMAEGRAAITDRADRYKQILFMFFALTAMSGIFTWLMLYMLKGASSVAGM